MRSIIYDFEYLRLFSLELTPKEAIQAFPNFYYLTYFPFPVLAILEQADTIGEEELPW